MDVQSRISPSFIPVAVTGYAAIVAMAYHSAYWSGFDINILQVASFSDILRLCVVPLIAVAMSLLFGMAIGPRLATAVPSQTLNLIMVLYHVATLGLLISAWIWQWHWRHVLSMLMLTGLFARLGLPAIKWLFPKLDELPALLAALVLFSMPPVAAGVGWSDAEAIKTGQVYLRFIAQDGSGSERYISDGELRYLGRTSETVLVFSPESSSTIVIPVDATGAYTLVRVPPRKDAVSDWLRRLRS